VSAILSRAGRSEILAEAHIDGTWDMRGTKLLVPPRFVLEIVSTVDDRPSVAETG
jgi:hypothetical protein